MFVVALLLATFLPVGSFGAQNADALRLWQALNVERATRGIGALVLDPTLTRLAYDQAADVAKRGSLSHLSSDGLGPFERMRRANVHFGYAGENLAVDFDVARADQALWQSEPHRCNTLEPHYQRIGVAAVVTPRGEYFVEDFSD